MKNSQWSKLKACMVVFITTGAMYSCNLDTVTDDLSEIDLQSEQILQNTNMRITPTVSCSEGCIEAGSENYYPISDMATLKVGKNTKSVSYTVYNTETDFEVNVTYAITAGPSKAKATITIDIDGNKKVYTDVISGSTVSHKVPLEEGWVGCDQVAFRVVQEALGTPITFSESYSLFPVCTEETLEIGMEYQGGIIAYILQDGDPGYDENVPHGLIAAPGDQSTGIGIQWWNGAYLTTGATGTALGTGQANTTAIVNSQGTGSYAAQLCNDLVIGEFDDWYLPSKDELYKFFINKAAVGGFVGDYYWSSSEGGYMVAWLRFFGDSYQGVPNPNWEFQYVKNVSNSVRAIRSF